MKYFHFLPVILFLFAGIPFSNAQDTSAQNRNVTSIFDSLQDTGPGMGSVVIHQPDAVRNMVGKRLHGNNVEESNGEYFLIMDGFRTQIFSGNNQRSSKDEAFRKEKEIKEIFPELPTYVTYTAPFWKLRVGDFRSHDEAYHMLRSLKDAFPSYGKEMYIVSEKIKIPLY